MELLDWAVIGGYFILMVVIGVWAKARVHSTEDFFAAGGRMPWWLSGISHHMSGYSSAVFVGYAAIAYSSGFALYVWWAIGIAFAMLVGSLLFAPRWPRLRQQLGVISPLEYLTTRFNLPTQQLLAWSGTALKVFDVAAKWAATALLLQVFAGVPVAWGILLTGGVTLVYSTIGGIWADALTDLGQFIVQLIAGITMFIAVLVSLGGVSSIWTMWDRLPAGNAQPFNNEYTVGFFLVYLLVNTLSYNGGTWNLAQRFISAPSGSAARRSALLSASLYLIWPLVLFFPMWAAPILLPGLTETDQSYALLAQQLLPAGMIGLVLAGMFAHTMAMTGSDANAISSVVIRDIIPAVWRRAQRISTTTELIAARVSVFVFIALSMGIALTADSFGGVLGLLILWFGALVGPIAIPMLLGMLPAFRHCGPVSAVSSWTAGLATFFLVKYVFGEQVASLGTNASTVEVGTPVVVALVVFVLTGLLAPKRDEQADALIDSIAVDQPDERTPTTGS